MKNLAIVPARGGSKRLPNKNIKTLNGFPLIYWTIKAAFESKSILDVIVSTDCPEIAAISESLGASVPVLRPKHLAQDHSTTLDAVDHMVTYLLKTGKKYKNLIILQPTSPLRNSHDIDEALQYFHERKLFALTSICEVEHPMQWMNQLPSSKSMKNFLKPELISKRSQEFEKLYRLNGAIKILDWGFFIKEKTLFPNKRHEGFEMPLERSVDIDNEYGAAFAEFLLQKNLVK